MISQPRSFFTRLGRHLGLTGGPFLTFSSRISSKILAMPRKLSNPEFLEAKLAGRASGDEEQRAHYRKGQSGDWRRYFDKDISTEFKNRFPNLLSQLGYESSEDW
jgi:hypothetical protein